MRFGDVPARDSNILMMRAAISSPASTVSAVGDGFLVAKALHLIKPNLSLSWTKPTTTLGTPGACVISQHSADYVGIVDVPAFAVAAYGPPLAVVVNLHPTLVAFKAVP